ncbi:AraC family transcriptional regulator [Helicobacter apodemus]|uniref:AraC family transcriptional regulator n=1 Tax=Helicobacter apodemus TaxID=135569 RepID=A0A4U8UDX7_9HELI|nr:AraC family transcriptional regulator [Helicobacter apodemus]
MNEICRECGFASTSWFVTRFKEAFGETPKQYQKSKNLYFSPKTHTTKSNFFLQCSF